ncbi:transposase-like protein [Symbiobacterium thermophilum IAM 14863]|uniref:Transposase-like protein n=1 Tax=Symbiobacterium thermophilum (strain DSM 24528 / JCM 14929 / IAM 14863 / T) TaxID=292459 RepID=Q67PW2_SYMTH|nr:transposase-like protein [Symbiobacterium thermophilum IAM 14863]
MVDHYRVLPAPPELWITSPHERTWASLGKSEVVDAQDQRDLRLKWEVGLSARQIARSLSISHSTVLDMLRRFECSGLSWPLPNIDDAELEAKLYPGNPQGQVERPLPDMAYIHRELARKGVTL